MAQDRRMHRTIPLSSNCALAAVEPGPAAIERARHDPGTDRDMLGVRREGVTEAAGKLQTAGLIQYNRGHIKVLDRPKLEERVCECYAVVKRGPIACFPEGKKPNSTFSTGVAASRVLAYIRPFVVHGSVAACLCSVGRTKGPVRAASEHALRTACLPLCAQALSAPAHGSRIGRVTFGEILHEPGKRIKHVYFPNDSLVSLLTVVEAISPELAWSAVRAWSASLYLEATFRLFARWYREPEPRCG